MVAQVGARESVDEDQGRVLLTGATGFVGQRLLPALKAAGYRVRCCSRDPEGAAKRQPDEEWVRFDVADAASVDAAMVGCDAAVYLVHGMGADEDDDYPARERAGARGFRLAAERHGLRRVVYLGGPEPEGEPSRHLKSRLETGEILRSGSVSAIELRASMVIGAGSAGWVILGDLARRLPVMVLPTWLKNHSWPVGIGDVVNALLASLSLPGSESQWLDLPGPERISHKALLRRTSAKLGRRPLLIDVPVLSPWLSSHWIGLVTRADGVLARDLVQGLAHDLDPRGQAIWDLVPGLSPRPLDEAIQDALAAESREAQGSAANKSPLNTSWSVEAFYDGDCPLCLREVKMLSRLDRRRQRIKWTDISASEFDPSAHGMTRDDFMDQMQGRLADGTWISGVEVFRQLYQAVGLGPVVALSRLPGISSLADRAYALFARNRLRLTGRCAGGACEVPAAEGGEEAPAGRVSQAPEGQALAIAAGANESPWRGEGRV